MPGRGVSDVFHIKGRGTVITGQPRDVLRNRVVQFEPNAGATMGPQFSVLEPKKKRWRR
jgi:hypothetical protein